MTSSSVVATKVCIDCDDEHPIDMFKLMQRYGKRAGETQRHPRCDDCRKSWHRDYYQQRKTTDPGYARVISRKSTLKKYGLTLAEYDALLAAQDGECAICGSEPGGEGVTKFNLVVDHDHDCCGENKACVNCRRELLCDFCNRGLGIFHDDPDLLLAAAMYVLKHREGVV